MSSPEVYDSYQGTLWKPGIWSTYIVFNYVGSFLCCLVLRSIYLHKARTSADILLSGLFSGCIWMSLTCGSQCVVSLIHNYFYGGPIACWLEAWFHVSGILVMFLSVTALSLRNYWSVVRNVNIDNIVAGRIVVTIWIVCAGVTFGLGFVSPIYLVSNGTYCFYQFKSPAVTGWLVPWLLIALLCMFGSYYQIYRQTQIITGNANRQDQTLVAHTIVKRAALFILVLLLGWITAAITAVYELVHDTAPEGMVTALGVTGTAHTVAVAVVYTVINPYHNDNLKRWLCYCRWKPEVQPVRVSQETQYTSKRQQSVRYLVSAPNTARSGSQDSPGIPKVAWPSGPVSPGATTDTPGACSPATPGTPH